MGRRHIGVALWTVVIMLSAQLIGPALAHGTSVSYRVTVEDFGNSDSITVGHLRLSNGSAASKITVTSTDGGKHDVTVVDKRGTIVARRGCKKIGKHRVGCGERRLGAVYTSVGGTLGAGNDVITLVSSDPDRLRLGPGDDVVRLVGSYGPTAPFEYGGVSAGPGNDRMSSRQAVDLDGDDGNDTIVHNGIGHARGGPGDDVLIGGKRTQGLSGGEGNDIATGGPGQDIVSGGPGLDTIDGGADDDLVGFDVGYIRNNGNDKNVIGAIASRQALARALQPSENAVYVA